MHSAAVPVNGFYGVLFMHTNFFFLDCVVSVPWLANVTHVIFVKTSLWNADIYIGLFFLPEVHIDLYEV